MDGQEKIRDYKIKFLMGEKIFEKFSKVFDSCCGGISKDNGESTKYLNQKGQFKTLIRGAYANEAAAVTAGLTTGDLYQTTGTAASPLNVAGLVLVKQ